MPTQHISLPGEFERARRFEFEPGPLFELNSEPLDAAFFQNIFKPGMLPIRPIAKIPMNRNHGFGNSFQVFWLEETDDVSKAWERVRIAMGHSEAASGQQIVAGDYAAFNN